MNYVPWGWKIIVNFNCIKMISFRRDMNSTNTNRLSPPPPPPQKKKTTKKPKKNPNKQTNKKAMRIYTIQK